VLSVRESARAVRDRDGTTLYYEGTIEDVTAQRQADEERRRLVAAVEQASETIVITDVEGRIEYVNPAFERISGYTRAEAIGRKPSLLNSGRHDDAHYAAMWQTITRGETWSGHFVNKRKDGSLYEEEAVISPIRDGRGTIVNFVAVKRDVTHEVALQTQVRQAQKMEAVGMLAGGVAHDFNNLLQAMLTHVELVHGSHVDAAQMAATMAELEAEIRRGSALTRQLLLFSRRETARPEQLDLNEAIRSAATFLRRLVRANVAFNLELADELLPVSADRGQLDQVLMNLVVNAADAMPEGGRLTIRTGREGLGWVWFAAEDTGTGIPAEIRERIFEPFFTTKGKEKGTGLGLSVVHGIVTQHSGVVGFEDLRGGGTSFRVKLPRAGSAEYRAVHLPEIDSSMPGGHGERVLVVEDEENARQGLAEILRALGYDVVALGSGEEAGSLPHDPAFDALLTDMMLPGIAGGELARGLLNRWPRLKVVLMSGYTEDEAVRRGAVSGRVRFLQKPFDMATLAREISAALRE
jgi:PAS domain S-box-containing protein